MARGFYGKKVFAQVKPSFTSGMQNAKASGLPASSLSDIVFNIGGWMFAVGIAVGTVIFIRRR